MKMNARLTFDKIQSDQDVVAHLVLSLTAPPVNVEDKRPPLCIVPLIDVSPSMQGEKLMYAKRSLLKLIDHMAPNDYCGLVSFSGRATVESEPVLCSKEAKDELKKKVEQLRVSGATNIADALLEGFRLANGMDLSAEVITRVILFTDGMANTGPVTSAEDIVALAKSNLGISSVSAFGYGSDVHQDFLLDLSKQGKGNYAFVENPDDALSAFGKELGGLLSTYANNLMIDVEPLAGHSISQVVSDVEAEEDGLGHVVLKISDILSEETRNIVLAVKFAPSKAGPRAVNVFDVKMGYDTLDANLKREHHNTTAKAKVQFVKEGEVQTTATPELDRIVGLAEVVRAQIEAEKHAKLGNYDAAALVMTNISDHVGSRGLNDIGIAARSLGQKVGSRAAYFENSAYLAGFSSGATRGVGGTYGSVVSADLGNLGVCMSNTAQAATASSFESGRDLDSWVGDPPTDNPDWVISPVVTSVTPQTNNPSLDPSAIQDILDAAGKSKKKGKKATKPSKKISQKPSRW